MAKKKCTKVAIGLLLAGLFAVSVLPAFAAAPTSGILKGVQCAGSATAFDCKNSTDPSACGNTNAKSYAAAPDCTLCDIVTVGVNLSNLIVGSSAVIALLMLIVAGIMMIVAYGNTKLVTQAKGIIKSVIIGLVLIFFSYTIVNIVLITIGGASSTGGMQAIYTTITGKSEWGTCDVTKLPTK